MSRAGALHEGFPDLPGLPAARRLHWGRWLAAGLILATAVKMGINLFAPEGPAVEGASTLEATPVVAPPRAGYWTWERVAQVVLCALGFVGVGLLRWPLAAVVAGLAPIAIAIAWFMDR